MKNIIFARIMLGLIALMMGLVLFSCSPQRRLNHLLKAHSELIKRDTIFKTDTLITHHYHVDTILSIHHHYGDTVIIRDHKLTERIIYLKGDSIEVQGEVQRDTIFKNVPYYINTVQAKEVIETGFFAGIWNNIKDFLSWLGVISLLILIVAVLWKIFRG